MASKTEKGNGRPEAEPEQRDFKWAVEWLVRREGQRRTAEILGVNRKTVALALRRNKLTGRMNHAVQTLLANLDEPEKQRVMPLDRIESQINLLLESVEELDGLVEGLGLRVKALEDGQARARSTLEAQVDVDHETEAREDRDVEGEGHAKGPAEGPEATQVGRQGGWRRR